MDFKIIVMYFLFWWLCQIVYKITDLDKQDNSIKNYVANIKSKLLGDFLYKLVGCQLCMESHLAFIIFLPFAIINQDVFLIGFGYSMAGFNSIIKSLQ